jgi:phosphoribosylanthranilate isomerase
MSVRLKVCGMRDHGNVLAVAKLCPDYMGFIFYEGSPRFVGDDFLIPNEFLHGIKRVGVFVDEEVEQMLSISKKYRLDFIQLHGDESVSVCKRLNESDLGVIKVFRVDNQFDFKETYEYRDVVDFFLFDTKGKNYGGNAVRFNWNILHNYDQEVPFFLSGGITPENVSEISALSGLNLHAIDVNSGVETAPGLKSIDKVKGITTILKSRV